MTSRQTRRRQALFLQHFRIHGNVTFGCREAGVPRPTIYWWQEHDDQFAAAFREAEIEATEHLESEARRRAVDGVVSTKGIYSRQGQLIAEETETKYSDTLLVFLLKARAPEKYRERVQLQHADAEGGQLDLASLVLSARGAPVDANA